MFEEVFSSHNFLFQIYLLTQKIKIHNKVTLYNDEEAGGNMKEHNKKS